MELASIPRELPQFGRHLSSLVRTRNELFAQQNKGSRSCECHDGQHSCGCNSEGSSLDGGAKEWRMGGQHTNVPPPIVAPPVQNYADSCTNDQHCSATVVCTPLERLPETITGELNRHNIQLRIDLVRHCSIVMVDCDGKESIMELTFNGFFNYRLHKSSNTKEPFRLNGRQARQVGGNNSMVFVSEVAKLPKQKREPKWPSVDIPLLLDEPDPNVLIIGTHTEKCKPCANDKQEDDNNSRCPLIDCIYNHVHSYNGRDWKISEEEGAELLAEAADIKSHGGSDIDVLNMLLRRGVFRHQKSGYGLLDQNCNTFVGSTMKACGIDLLIKPGSKEALECKGLPRF